MKKVNLADKLNLSKEVVANLSDEQLQEIEGGAAANDAFSCFIESCIGNTRIDEVAE